MLVVKTGIEVLRQKSKSAADLTEEQHRPDPSALETVPSPHLENVLSPRPEADEMECDAGRTHGPGQAIHAPEKKFAPLFEAPTPPCLGDGDETEPETDMDEGDAQMFSLPMKAAKARGDPGQGSLKAQESSSPP